MHTPLNASATTAGALISSSIFEVPPFQREYTWLEDEVNEFWNDLSRSVGGDPYFLGLVILTDEGGRKQVVDGQQRILTLTLLAAALHQQASESGRSALADRLQADFLRSIDYDTDATNPRVTLSDQDDNATLQSILDGKAGQESGSSSDYESLSIRMKKAYFLIRDNLEKDLSIDKFKRLGLWADFITNKLYFAVFIHPDPASAYRVFEVINTRGRELTTADLLKNFVLSQTPNNERDSRYRQWKEIAKEFPPTGSNSFVQYIRHVVTAKAGHILPKDLYDFLASRYQFSGKQPPTVPMLMEMLKEHLPLYLQMMDTSLGGPADTEALKVFSAFNSLGVISVRPILLAMHSADDPLTGMHYILKLIVRRMVVGNIGTGNVERKFGEAARQIVESGGWCAMQRELKDLDPRSEEFVEQLRKRSFNKSVLTFLRLSIVTKSITPDQLGFLHFIRPRHATEWKGFGDEELAYWAGTIGNTFLSTLERRSKRSNDWDGFKQNMLSTAVEGEWTSELEKFEEWNANTVEELGKLLAVAAADVWF